MVKPQWRRRRHRLLVRTIDAAVTPRIVVDGITSDWWLVSAGYAITVLKSTQRLVSNNPSVLPISLHLDSSDEFGNAFGRGLKAQECVGDIHGQDLASNQGAPGA